jgi:DNA-binding NarL/FixJ family response regulator
MDQIRIVIVEDEPEFRRRVSEIIRAEPGFALVGAAGNGAEALALIEGTTAEVFLVDLGLPDMDGTRVIRAASARYPEADVVVVTVFGDDRHVLSSIEAGATGYLLKDVSAEDLVRSIRSLRAGGSPISPVIARRLLQRLRPPSPADDAALSPREREILQFIAKGFSFEEVGGLLAISAHTATSHVKNIYRKLAVHSRGEAVYEANKLGMLRL